MEDSQDAYGHQVYDYLKGKRDVAEIVERDDNFISVSGGAKFYFKEYRDWQDREKKAIQFGGWANQTKFIEYIEANSAVLDFGCGAGRVLLYLQKKGFDVLGIDVSPLAIRVCRMRGLKNARLMPITKVSSKLGPFGTLIMFGNNFGLFASRKRARWLLKRFRKLTTAKARIIAESLDPYQTDNSDHLQYHRLNRRRGRMAGQIRIRVRYRKYVTPWFDYLLVSKQEMQTILKGTGWILRRVFTSAKSPAYIAIIEKEKSHFAESR
jgi:SAM-dependent methyltransferase